jgi:hypothetical protein
MGKQRMDKGNSKEYVGEMKGKMTEYGQGERYEESLDERWEEEF